MLAITLSMPPYAEFCSSRTAELVNWDFRGNEEGGESTPNRDGTEAAIVLEGPCIAAHEIPLLSKLFGRGASSTESPFKVGEVAMRSFVGGEPNLGDADVYVTSGCCISYPFCGPY